MTPRVRTPQGATVGVVEQSNAVTLVTLAPDGALLDRRSIVLTDRDLPTHPHHHEGSQAVGRYANRQLPTTLSLAEAVTLVARVREAAAQGAQAGLEALATAVGVPITGVALRVCPALPPTTEERIIDNRAQAVADSVMYREALAAAAAARGWRVHWYDRNLVHHQAAETLGGDDIEAVLSAMGRAVGPPWRATHKLAAAAALVAAHAGPAAGGTTRSRRRR